MNAAENEPCTNESLCKVGSCHVAFVYQNIYCAFTCASPGDGQRIPTRYRVQQGIILQDSEKLRIYNYRL